MNETSSPSVADIAAVVDNNRGYAYPVFPYGNGGGFGNGGYGSDWLWVILLLALFGGFNGNGNGGFGNGFNNDYAWLSNGQKEIMQNTNQGFDTLHLSNQVEGVRDGIHDIQNAICNSTASINSNVSNGFYNAEIGANNRQMANMQQAFDLSRQFADCCCENRLGIQDLKSTVISENCADREVLRQIGQDILVNQTANTQKIIDEIFRDRLDEKDDKIAELNRQLQMADLRASQIAQTQAITSNIYNELKNCPVGTVPVFRKSTDFYMS
jgi:hypothetical protein